MIVLAGNLLSHSGAERGGIFFKLMVLVFLAVLLAAVYVVRHPLLRLAGNFWVVDDVAQPSDAIVILSDDNYDGDRARRAAELFRAGMAPHIVASGRYLRPYASVAELMIHDLKDRGVPESAIVPFSHRAQDTREEAAALAPFLAGHGWKKIILVTSNFHTRRTKFIFERTLDQGTQLRVVSAPDFEYDPNNWWRSREGVKIFVHESVGYVVAWWEMRHQDARTR